MTLQTVGIVSPGEMGSAIATVVASNGLRPVTTLEGRSRETRENAAAADIEDVGSAAALAEQADVVLSVVPSDAAFDVARTVADGAAAAGTSTILAELNAIAPSTVAAIDDEVGDTLDVVDGCIIGPARDLSRATVFLSGRGADTVARLGEHGLDTEVLGDDIGQASGLKLCYAGLTKGVQSLSMELLLSGAALDIEGPLREIYASRRPGVLAYIDDALPRTPKRAARRSAEMTELETMLEGIGLDGELAAANHDRLAWLGEFGLDTDDAEDGTATARAVYDAWDATREPDR